MKLLVFAHTPPPHHGQSYMVQLLLEGLGGEVRGQGRREASAPAGIDCYHVNCRFSTGQEDIGQMRWGKLARLLKHCGQALWLRARYGARHLYYVPAPGARPAVYRDWMVMLLCRPFFRRVVFHWHAAGLAEWVETEARPWERRLTRWLLGHPSVSVMPAAFGKRDGIFFGSARMEVVPNGIPDPCPAYEQAVLPRRRARASARARLARGQPLPEAERAAAGEDPACFRVLYLGTCVKVKGIFDAIDAVVLVNRRLAREQSPLRARLTLAGKFWFEPERQEFDRRLPELAGQVEYAGFVGGAEKARLLRESDCLCFPTYYAAESFGLVLVEAMAFGLPIITTRWRAIPEMFPEQYPWLVEPRAPEQLAQALSQLMGREYEGDLRRRFLEQYTVERFVARMRAVFEGLESSSITPPP